MSQNTGWFDKTITIRDVIALLAFVFLLGQLYTKFQIIETQIAVIMEEEEYVATKEELGIVENRLRNWISRVEGRDEMILDLERRIFQLEVQDGS
jgi:hypothetical protein